MASDSLTTVMERHGFYQDGYKKASLIVVAMLVLSVMLLVLDFSLLANRKRPPEFFTLTCDGNFATVTPLSSPYVSDAKVLSWAATAISSAYSMDYIHFREQLESNSTHFTPLGWRSFGDVFKASRNLETVIDRKLIVSSVPTAAPVITKRGVLNGRYTWQVEMPILVSYQNKDTDIQQSLKVTVNVVRTPLSEGQDGIAISQYIATE